MIDPEADTLPREPARDRDLAAADLTRLLASQDPSDVFALLFYMQQPIEYRLPVLATSVLPRLSARVTAWPPALQVQLASTLHLLQSSSIRVAAAHATLAVSLALLADEPDRTLLHPWGVALAAALPHVDWAAVGSFDAAHALLIDFSQHPDPVFRRVAAAALGPLASTQRAVASDQLLLDAVHALSHDEDARVRAALAASLASLAGALPLHVGPDPPLWPVFLTLLRDADAATQAASVQSFAQAVHAAMHPTHGLHNSSSTVTHPLSTAGTATTTTLSSVSALPSALQKTALSVFMTECSLARVLVDNPRSRSPADVGALLRALADAFGPMLHALAPLLSDRQLVQAFSSYCALAGFPHASVRRAAAFNFPAVAAVVGPEYSRVLGELVEMWMRDEDARVRASLAAGLHVVAAALAGTPVIRTVLRASLRLLDDVPIVRTKLVARLANLLAPVCRDARAIAPAFVADVCHVLRRSTNTSWRVQADLVTQLRRATDFLPECTLLEHVLPAVMDVGRRGSFTVRAACMALAGRLVAQLSSRNERDTAVRRLVSQWARADVFKRRVAFVEFAASALAVEDLAADERVRALCEDELVALCKDAVSNVRLRVAQAVRSGTGECLSDEAYAAIVGALADDVDEVRAVMAARDYELDVRDGGGRRGKTLVEKLAASGEKDCEKEKSGDVENASDENAGHACNRDEDRVTNSASDLVVGARVALGVGGVGGGRGIGGAASA